MPAADAIAEPIAPAFRKPGGEQGFGGVVWPIGGNEAHVGPRFDIAVNPGGYAWWYCDALSDDGRFGLTIIAFIGSVFSPYYAWSGRKDPRNHSAINVAIYGRNTRDTWTKGRWAMTERGRDAVEVDERSLRIGPSSLEWDGTALTVNIDETTAPIPTRLKGRVRVIPDAVTRQIFGLDPEGHHRWWPIAPSAHVEVELSNPDLSWTGSGYFDTNDGEIPLEDSFDKWDWSRASLASGAAVLYDVTRADGERRSLALRFDENGGVAAFEAPQRVSLPPTSVWRVARQTQADGGRARVAKTFEDTPFYSRSELETEVLGETVSAVHESLSLQRFKQDWVKVLLPFRMPRAVAS